MCSPNQIPVDHLGNAVVIIVADNHVCSLQDPTVSIAHVYYWYCLGHIEVEYKITANDGEDITSSTTITSVADPSMTVSMPSKTGAGTIDANADGTGKLTYMSADQWKTDVTLAYTLNAECTLGDGRMRPASGCAGSSSEGCSGQCPVFHQLCGSAEICFLSREEASGFWY